VIENVRKSVFENCFFPFRKKMLFCLKNCSPGFWHRFLFFSAFFLLQKSAFCLIFFCFSAIFLNKKTRKNDVFFKDSSRLNFEDNKKMQ